MTRFVFNTAATLDGYLADPDHSLGWLFAVEGGSSTDAPEHADAWQAFMDRVGVAVYGSSTYEWVLRESDALAQPEQWAQASGGKPVVVFSTRDLPIPPGADVRIVQGNVADHRADIEATAAGGDVWIVGGGDLVGQFDDAGALDEIQVSIAPVTLGAGAPLLPRRIESHRMRLVDVERRGQFAHLTYAVTRGRT
ncbi:dihydrofolate reductase [Aeromicrobium phragmitis]|uniref:Dihydrofolate reductase n=1 Tax=Aeromicrobium phragmitis TaxID=2478914 RepID=A0A3L8PMA1_9ACTN|nr:dihydrofolate reductase family protein [Aeromicrobium phragmitis]RLV56390.1 dihydrofolate reductase [Aeromicrobium phragmitis]